MSGRTYIKLRDRPTQPEDRERSIKRLVSLAMADADMLALHLGMLAELMPNSEWLTDCLVKSNEVIDRLRKVIPNE